MKQGMDFGASKSAISTPEEVAKLREDLDKQGRRLVFTNGCFDLLHAGHVRYLAEARALGDALVVALNSDDSVRQLKGPSRPVNTEEDRAEILTALRSVDAVCVFHEPRVTRLIESIQPHVYAKGGDYTVESLNPEERGALEKVGAKIEILGLVPGRSTTATLKRAAAGETPPEKQKLRIGILGSGSGSNFQA
ncbi:MAG: D-beta-D-heptose 1-phosphate adenylyltransferase, partial [Verrucomicrobiaceae bacterium]|nr:D-beta-D-heptose 1-phosphate adenylyltransferase [Verrucomicrobiaceae bacterium]